MTDAAVNTKVGLFGIGLEAYWSQYAGLRERLEGYQAVIHAQLAQRNVMVVDAGMVDSPEKARAAAQLLQREGVALIFLYISTYALSSTVLPVVQQARVPVIVLNLQPVRAIDYAKFNALGDRTMMTGEWLAHCQACSVPEVANVFRRARITFHQITGTIQDDPLAWGEINDWLDACRVAGALRANRLGLLGNYYNGMLDIYSDPTQQALTFGGHVEHIEVSELKGALGLVSEPDIAAKLGQIAALFDIVQPCPPEDLRRAAQAACALDAVVEAHKIGALAYYFSGAGDPAYEDLFSSLIVGCTLLTAQHVPCAGEYEVKNAQAMKIMDAFGAGGSFTEFYAMDFDDDVVLMGHDGPAHIAIAEGRPMVKALKEFHGKRGSGVSIEMRVKNGPVTCLSVAEDDDGGLKLVIAEGESVPGPILEIGNTNSRYRFAPGARQFMDAWCRHGPAHHCAVGVGHLAGKIEKFGALIGVKTERVC